MAILTNISAEGENTQAVLQNNWWVGPSWYHGFHIFPTEQWAVSVGRLIQLSRRPEKTNWGPQLFVLYTFSLFCGFRTTQNTLWRIPKMFWTGEAKYRQGTPGPLKYNRRTLLRWSVTISGAMFCWVIFYLFTFHTVQWTITKGEDRIRPFHTSYLLLASVAALV